MGEIARLKTEIQARKFRALTLAADSRGATSARWRSGERAWSAHARAEGGNGAERRAQSGRGIGP